MTVCVCDLSPRGDDGKTGPGSSPGMVGLVAGGVEDGHHAIAGELLDDTAGRIDDRDDGAPVLVEHADDLGR